VQKPLGDKSVLETELEGFGIRLNKKPPAMTVRKKVRKTHTPCKWYPVLRCKPIRFPQEKGGIAVTNTVPLTNLDHDDIKGILSEYKVIPHINTMRNLIELFCNEDIER